MPNRLSFTFGCNALTQHSILRCYRPCAALAITTLMWNGIRFPAPDSFRPQTRARACLECGGMHGGWRWPSELAHRRWSTLPPPTSPTAPAPALRLLLPLHTMSLRAPLARLSCATPRYQEAVQYKPPAAISGTPRRALEAIRQRPARYGTLNDSLGTKDARCDVCKDTA